MSPQSFIKMLMQSGIYYTVHYLLMAISLPNIQYFFYLDKTRRCKEVNDFPIKRYELTLSYHVSM